MTENKRFVNENDGDIRDTSTMIKYYCLSLTGKELCDLLNDQDSRIKETEQIIERLYVFFLKWFEEERGMNPHDFGLWWCSIGLGETTFEKL